VKFLGARCAETDPEIFFPEKGQNHHVKYAKKICSGCPFNAACLTEALKVNYIDDHGIWGGTTREERNALRLGMRAVAA
jgi:WhiB family redox-sensing transcriptional regulator